MQTECILSIADFLLRIIKEGKKEGWNIKEGTNIKERRKEY